MQKSKDLKNSICLCTSPFTHLLDHLANVAYILDIPLIVSDPTIFEIAKKYYPFTNTHYIPERNCSLAFFAKNFDTIFVSCKYWSRELALSLKKLFDKEMRFFYVPHGNSDKGHIDPAGDLLMYQDLTFVYGNHMKDMLQNRGVLSSLSGFMTVGNFRYECYLKHKKFYDDMCEDEIFSKFQTKTKTLLYAPTWKDPEDSSSFFHVSENLLKHLPKHYNLLIKMHPKIEEDDPAKLCRLMAKYENLPNVIFLPNTPIVYPILARADVYLGDFSSVGYDMLTFNKPMYFFNPNKRCPSKDLGLFLYQTGIEIPQNAFENIYPFLEKTLPTNTHDYQDIRKKIFDYTFDQGIDFQKIKEDSIHLLNTTSFSLK